MKSSKGIWVALIAVAIIALIGWGSPQGGEIPLFGGTTNFDALDVSDGYSVDGTSVIDGSGNFDGAITASSINGLESYESITSDNTLTVAESHKVSYVNASGSTTTLPAVASSAGTIFKFVVSGAFDTNNFVIDSAEGDNIEGTLLVAGAVVDCAAEDQINFIVDGENVGDYVEVASDGTNWLIRDSGALTASKLTCTDPN